jgi:hypothetical protein
VFISGYVHQAALDCSNHKKARHLLAFADFISEMNNESDLSQSKK